jgi:hypothetical protein
MFTGPGKCLDVVNDGVDNHVTMDNCAGYSGQYWHIAEQPGW